MASADFDADAFRIVMAGLAVFAEELRRPNTEKPGEAIAEPGPGYPRPC
jgi:hypothetical protein